MRSTLLQDRDNLDLKENVSVRKELNSTKLADTKTRYYHPPHDEKTGQSY